MVISVSCFCLFLEMAEDFDVEAMLEAPYKKGVSYIHSIDDVTGF